MMVVSSISDCACNRNERTCWTYFFNLKKMKRDTIKLIKFYCVYLVYCLVINSVFCRLQFIMLLLKCRFRILKCITKASTNHDAYVIYLCRNCIFFTWQQVLMMQKDRKPPVEWNTKSLFCFRSHDSLNSSGENSSLWPNLL